MFIETLAAVALMSGGQEISPRAAPRGDWEVCTDAYFRGNCQVVRQDIRNLQNWGINDRISSLRPVRRGGGRW